MAAARHKRTAVVSGLASLALLAVPGTLEQLPDTDIPAPASIAGDTRRLATSPAVPRALPVAELRTALTAACASDAGDSNDREWTQEDTQAQIDAFNELERNLSHRLSVSPSAEHLHLAALLEDDPVLRIELLDRAISTGTSDAFLVWGAVRVCSDSGVSPICPLRDWERRLVALDGQNSESWVRVAANRYAAGQLDEALEAMRRASTAAESRAYWTEMIEMIERGLAAGSDLAFPERAGMALGFAASMLPRYGDYVAMCKERSAASVNWAYACLAYGELVASRGKTVMGISIALSIQQLALAALGEPDRAAAVEQRLHAHRQDLWDSLGEHHPATERLIFSNPTLFYAYLAAIRSEGELAARARIGKEVERLVAEQPELACRRS